MTGETIGRPVRKGHERAAVPRVARTSTVDLIATELRSADYSGALAVGEPLREVDIAAQLGVSRSPLREAAQRLVAEGLLTSVPGRGIRVPRIDADDVADVYAARLAIEAEAVRRVIARGDDADLDLLDEAITHLQHAARGDNARAIGDADLAFHQLLTDRAESPRLSSTMAALVVQTRIASFSVPGGYTVPRSVSATYDELMAALHAGDAPAALACLDRQFAAAVARLQGRDAAIDTVGFDEDEKPLRLRPIGEVEENGGR